MSMKSPADGGDYSMTEVCSLPESLDLKAMNLSRWDGE